MRLVLSAFLLAVAVPAKAVLPAPPPAPIPPEMPAASGDASAATLGRARDAVMPHVVSILVVREDFEDGEPKLSVSSGSGTVIDAQGHVATNAHVTDRGRSYRVVFGDGREREAVLVGQDTASDLAVLRVRGEPLPMPHARFAPPGTLRAGQTVLAMGAPWGLSNSLSAGVVNNPRRLLVSLFEDEADYEDRIDADAPTGRYYAWIQHDAAIAPGNSGGPLVDLEGRIVGVNTRGMLFGGDLAFAIPVDDVQTVVAALVAEGRVRRSGIGLRLRSLRGSGETRGVLVNAVERGGPAERAGLRPGERLLALEGSPVDAAQAVDVPGVQRRIAELPAGREVRLRVSGAAGEREVRLTPVAVDELRGERAAFPPFGLALQELTPAMSQRRRLDVERGLLVESLRAGGPAAVARPAVPAGAILLAVDGQPVHALADLDAWRTPRRPARPAVLEYLVGDERRVSALVPVWGDRAREPLPELPKAWSGAEVQPVPASLATALGLPAAGFRVTRLYPGSALAAAGVRVGDLLVSVDGDPLPAVNDTRAELFAQRLREFEIGDRVRFDGFRGTQARQWQATLAASPVPVAALPSLDVLALRAQFRELGFFDRVDRELAPDQPGVLVQAVEAGGPAGLAHLQAGDVLLRIGDRRIDGLDALQAALPALMRGGERWPLEIIRDGETRIVHIERRWIPEVH